MKEQIIQLEPHDDVVSVCDRLGWLRAPRALLIFPLGRENRILHRKLDLILVQRELTRRRAQFALITDDPVVMDHARDLGIPTFNSIEESHANPWESLPAPITAQRTDQPRPFNAELFSIASRLRETPQRNPPFNRTTSRIGFGLALIALLAVAYVVVPSATVTVTPATNQVTITIPITADPTLEFIDFDNALIPARIVGVEVEDLATVETTGTKDTPDQKATGIVTFINQIPQEVTVPAGTVVRTTAGNPVRFVTTVDVTLPPTTNATVDASIEAVEPGVEANLPSNIINKVEGPLATSVRVINPTPTRGGDVRQVPAVSQSDYDRLRSALLQQLQQRAYGEMAILITDTEFVATESLAVVLIQDETYDRFTGEEATEVSLEMRVVVQGVVIDERSARQVALNELANKVGPGYEIGESTLAFRRGDVTQVDGERRVTFLMQGSGEIAVAIDTALVQSLVSGKSLIEAGFLLERELPLRQPPTIEVRPAILGHLPILPFRIQVEIASPT